jgi:hypothetical protein
MAPLVRVRGRIVRMGLLVDGVSLAQLVASGDCCRTRQLWCLLHGFRSTPCLDSNA